MDCVTALSCMTIFRKQKTHPLIYNYSKFSMSSNDNSMTSSKISTPTYELNI